METRFKTVNGDNYLIDKGGNKFKNGRCINDVVLAMGEIRSTPLPPVSKRLPIPPIVIG